MAQQTGFWTRVIGFSMRQPTFKDDNRDACAILLRTEYPLTARYSTEVFVEEIVSVGEDSGLVGILLEDVIATI